MAAAYSEKNDFIAWMMSKKSIFIIFFVLNVLAFSAVLRANCPYRDDIATTLNNSEEWEQSGRLFSYLLAKVYFFGMQADSSPFLQVAAIFVLSLAGLSLLYCFKKDGNFLHLLCFTPVCLSPYILENLSYRFGSLWTAISVFILIMPFVVLRLVESKKVVFWIAFVAVFLALNTYQPSFGVFLCIFVYGLLVSLRGDEESRFYKHGQFLLVLGALAALGAYFVEIKFIFPVTSQWGKSHSAMSGGDLSRLQVLFENTTVYYVNLALDWNRSIFEYILIVNSYVMLIVSIKHIFIKNNAVTGLVKSVAFIIMFLGLSIAPFFIQLFLIDPVYAPRTFLAVGVAFAFILLDPLLLMESKGFYRKIFHAVTIYASLQMIIITSTYGNLLASQMNWEKNRLIPLAYQLVKVQQKTNCHSIFYENTIGYSPAFSNISKKYPVLYRLIKPSVGNLYFASEVLRDYGLHLYNNIVPPPTEGIKVFYNEPWYIIAASGDVCILSFKQ